MHLLFEKAFDVGSELTQLHICHAKRHHNLRWQTQTTERSRVQELEFKRERESSRESSRVQEFKRERERESARDPRERDAVKRAGVVICARPA